MVSRVPSELLSSRMVSRAGTQSSCNSSNNTSNPFTEKPKRKKQMLTMKAVGIK